MYAIFSFYLLQKKTGIFLKTEILNLKVSLTNNNKSTKKIDEFKLCKNCAINERTVATDPRRSLCFDELFVNSIRIADENKL